MELIQRLNSTINYLEKHLTEAINYTDWKSSPAVPLITISECLPIWLAFRCPDISAGTECH